jgi:hypothetical protein
VRSAADAALAAGMWLRLGPACGREGTVRGAIAERASEGHSWSRTLAQPTFVMGLVEVSPSLAKPHRAHVPGTV